MDKKFFDKHNILRFYVFLTVQKCSTIICIAKITNITYSHVCEILKNFESDKLLVSRKSGRTKVYEYTQKGLEVYEIILKLTTVISK